MSKDLDLIAASTAANQVHLFNLRDGRFVQVIDVSQFVEKPFTDDKVPKTNYRIGDDVDWLPDHRGDVASHVASELSVLFRYQWILAL